MSAFIGFYEYQRFVPTTAIYPDAGTGSDTEVIYLGLGIMGEMQEWEEDPKDDREVGDIFWYIASLCNVYGLDMHWFWHTKQKPPECRPNIAEALKKLLRDGKEIQPAIECYIHWAMARIFTSRVEAGDTFFSVQGYVQRAMGANQAKLLARQEKGTLQGDGNDR